MNRIIFITLICLSFGCKAYNQSKGNIDTSKLYVIFIEKFKTDTVSVWINECQIIKDEIITSSQYGLTDLQMIISEPNKIFLRDEALNLSCNFDLNSVIDLRISLNGEEQLFKVDLRKGYYIGVDKGVDKLLLIQNKKPLEFD